MTEVLLMPRAVGGPQRRCPASTPAARHATRDQRYPANPAERRGDRRRDVRRRSRQGCRCSHAHGGAPRPHVRRSDGPMAGAAGRPRDLDRVVEAPVTAFAEQPSIRERRQSVRMPGTDPRAFTALRYASKPCPAGAWVPRPTGGLIPARILNPPRRSENRAHRGGVAIPVAGAPPRPADAQTRVRDDSIEAARRSMAPDHGRVTGALGAGKAGVDDLEQVGHRSSQAVCTTSLPGPAAAATTLCEPRLPWRRRAGR